MRRYYRLLLLLPVVLMLACGNLALSFRVAVIGVDGLVDSQVAANKLDRIKGEAIKTDFRDLRDAATALDTDLKAAAGDKIKRAAAATRFGRTTTAIAARGNIVGLNPLVSTVADIAFSIVDEIVAFYGAAPPSGRAQVRRSESELKKSIEEKIKQLDAATKAR